MGLGTSVFCFVVFAPVNIMSHFINTCIKREKELLQHLPENNPTPEQFPISEGNGETGRTERICCLTDPEGQRDFQTSLQCEEANEISAYVVFLRARQIVQEHLFIADRTTLS